MGDRYLPRYGSNRPPYGRESRHDHYSGQPYQHPPLPDRGQPAPRDDFRHANGGGYDRGYNFHGAAARDPYRPQDDFTFRAPGPGGPRFPPPDQYHRAPRYQQPEPYDQGARRDQPNHTQTRQRRDRNGRGRGRGGFKSRAAHTRDILQQTHGGSTPERLSGMNTEGKAHFLNLDSSSDKDEDDVVDRTADSDAEEGEIRRKRFKVDHVNPPDEAAGVPKWSNPDPYTALPPPSSLGAPKKDIVQTIRKAKVEAAARAHSAGDVQNNVDFISLNFDDDFEIDAASVASEAASTGEVPEIVPFNIRTQKASTGAKARLVVSPLDDSHSLRPRPSLAQRIDNHAQLPERPPVSQSEPQHPVRNRGKKRKHEEQSKAPGDIVYEWEPIDDNPTPWCTKGPSGASSSARSRLHTEINEFYAFVRPFDYEEAARRDLINRVQQSIRKFHLPGAKSVDVRSFGSFAAGLYLPTADMDLVALSQEFTRTGIPSFCRKSNNLFKLAAHLERSGVAVNGSVTPVTKAKVPIVKFVDLKTGIKVDISFENNSGLTANTTFNEWKQQFPAMPIIVVMIKQMLAMRGLNEVFNGGLGGFSIICLVVSMMQNMPELASADLDRQEIYGELFLDFLDLYGNRFDIQRVGITMDPPGYFDKVRNPRPKQNANNLTIIDPNNPMNDISGGSREIKHVFNVFRRAHADIQSRLTQIEAGQNINSILGCVLGGNYSLFQDQRDKLSSVQRRRDASPLPTAMTNGFTPVNMPKPRSQDANLLARPLTPLHRIRYGGNESVTSDEDMTEATNEPQATETKKPKTQPTKTKKPNKPKLEGRTQRRKLSKTIKSLYPQLAGLPKKLSMRDLPALCEKHGLQPGQVKQRIRQMPKPLPGRPQENAMELKKQFPNVRNIPGRITRKTTREVAAQTGLNYEDVKAAVDRVGGRRRKQKHEFSELTSGVNDIGLQ